MVSPGNNPFKDRPDVLDAYDEVLAEKSGVKALAELKRIISDNRHGSKLKQLNDACYHQILEGMFRVTKFEISKYVRAAKSQKSRVEPRLLACTGLVRTVIEVGLHRLRYRTVKALVEHIIQSMRNADGSYCEPLLNDYLKALNTLSSFKPHMEHFPSEDWHACVDFCLDLARDLIKPCEQDYPGISDSPDVRLGQDPDPSRQSRSVTPSVNDTIGSISSKLASQHTQCQKLGKGADDIVHCLQHLASIPNSPLHGKAQTIVTVVIDLLQSRPELGSIHKPAFEIIDSILSRMITRDISLALQIMRRLIPMLRTIWQENQLKEVVSSVLFRGEILLPRLISEDRPADCKLELNSLLEIWRHQYCARLPRERLLLEDLDLSDTLLNQEKRMPLSIRSAKLRSGAIRAEEPWALIHLSSAIVLALQKDASRLDGPVDADSFENPPKRRRVTRPLDEIFQFIRGPRTPEKLYALQVLTFVFESLDFDEDSLQAHLNSLLPCVSDDDGSIASWTMLTMTCAANQAVAGVGPSQKFWLQVWRLVARHITSSNTCRAACQLLSVILHKKLVSYVDVADIVDTIINSADLSGPAECDGSATTLWVILLKLRGQEQLDAASDISENVLRWLYKRWSPSNLRDRYHVMYIAQHVSVFSTMRLLCMCLGLQPPNAVAQSALNLGRLSQTRLECLRDHQLITYLLLNDEPLRQVKGEAPLLHLESVETKVSNSRTQTLASAMIQFLITEGSSILRSYFSISKETTSSINLDIIRVTTTFSILGFALHSSPIFQHHYRSSQLRTVLEELKDGLRTFISQHQNRKVLINGVYASFGSFLGPIGDLVPGRDLLTNGAIVMSQGWNRQFWQQTLKPQARANSVDNVLDTIDPDLDFDSQASRTREEDSIAEVVHDEVVAATNPDAFRACIAAKVCFMSGIENVDVGSHPETPATTSLVGYLTSLHGQEFVICRNVLRELLGSRIAIAEDDGDTLLQYVDQVIKGRYVLQKSEAAISVCLDVMANLAHMWANNENSDIAEAAAPLYKWIIDEILGESIQSAHVHVCAANLFQRLIAVRPEYASQLSLPSARTSLLEMLRDGDLVVKYHIGLQISNVFGLFVLKEHESILEDVIDSLPSDPTDSEGIALRLFVLACLAASWPTLLRRCVYAIFETPGHVPHSAGYAKHCLTQVSSSLGLPDCRDLFKLFVSQITYTWLATQPLRSIPFSIFGYASLRELLQDVRDEVVGQIVMRGKDDEAVQLACDLGVSVQGLLEVSFSKAMAYCIARDVALPAAINTQTPRADAGLRQILGKEKYTSLVTLHFAEILAIFYERLDQEEQIHKALHKRPFYAGANSRYRELLSYSSTSKTLPLNQQPLFSAKHLPDDIDYLCRRTSYDPETIWTPALYVYVFRQILGSHNTAFGSLHACSMLRKIRVLICMAGATALEHYPIEMALHAVRPFLTDMQCVEDATGITQYLLVRGASYLENVPSFVAGNAVLTLTSVRVFCECTQDSTTQESQFRATMSKAQAFHGWLSQTLERYALTNLSEESARSFKRIVIAASKVQYGGNSRIGTYESELLLEILEDQRSGRNLITQSSRDSILRFLCANFDVPSKFRDDILGTDEQAVLYAPTVSRICQRGIKEPSFLMWAGHVLGRAYAGKGLIDQEMISETYLNAESQSLTQEKTSASSSRVCLIKLLCEVLSSHNPQEVGIAESTLRSIVTNTAGDEDYAEHEKHLPSSLMQAMLWKEYHVPILAHVVLNTPYGSGLQATVEYRHGQSSLQWIQDFCIALSLTKSDDAMLSQFPPVLRSIGRLAEEAFPYILHLVLLQEADGHQTTRQVVSEACRQWFEICTETERVIPSIRTLLKAILYLRTQPLPHEIAMADRTQWLDIDHLQASKAAIRCSMFKTALLFLETSHSEHTRAGAVTSRRESAARKREQPQDPGDLLLTIYQNIDEQDAFYGVQQPSSLFSMMTRLEYEHAGFKSLSFRGAHYDGQIRQNSKKSDVDEESMVRALDSLDLNGLSQSLLNKMTHTGPQSIDAALRTARKLEQWDISAPASQMTSASIVFRAFQSINHAADPAGIARGLKSAFIDSMGQLLTDNTAKSSMHSIFGSLAALIEAKEVFSSEGVGQLQELLVKFEARAQWMHSQSFEQIDAIISCRETAFSSLSKEARLQDLLKTSRRDARMLESRVLLASSKTSRNHGALQNALTTATYLNQQLRQNEEVGLDMSAAVRYESANVLWSQGEMTASIRMLQDLQKDMNPKSQTVHVGKPELLAKLGHQISEARLEKPDEIISEYLAPAIKELHGNLQGDEASEVFHEFASFCDQQLQNPDSLEDFQRIQKLRERKEAEVRDLERMIKSAGSQHKEKDNLKSHRNKAKQWYDLDNREFQRLRNIRQTFLKQSLENYLLCLKASDKYDNNATRFSALWLENYDSEIANTAVEKHVDQVNSRKFASLMNQWSSRLLDVPSKFQGLLSALIVRICIDHPYHGMYQIFAGSKTKGGKDELALSRHAAANNIVAQLKGNNKPAEKTWLSIHNTNILFVRFAAERLKDPSIKPGSKVLLDKSESGTRIKEDVPKLCVPPPTITLSLRPSCDYTDVPMIAKFQESFTLASGISMPKIVTAIGTDGLKYKQLFKSGNDDLRQDSIMEQVFAQVSSLLCSQRPTRQRRLGIRTYKVLPLTATAGILEFVPNTIPLHDYLHPAHTRHFPNDLKPHACRKYVGDAQSKSVDQRIKVFRQVCEKFHPVLRYFFTERFQGPDEWFEKRLAYTRSTATVSILGHVLGLGDRHIHNILLDEKTGEVVHIDLGIAFEQGRVLPVPEIVPFRLTRDLVDGMGVTGTEGVFRRCCEFTLEALRNESYSIMTILDVLRYDPLYSWSVSPLRLKKMQDAQTEEVPNDEGEREGKGKEGEGEAERALMVVRKKLSKTLSVQAMVNELIAAATDERNLAVLFCGWAAYA